MSLSKIIEYTNQHTDNGFDKLFCQGNKVLLDKSKYKNFAMYPILQDKTSFMTEYILDESLGCYANTLKPSLVYLAKSEVDMAKLIYDSLRIENDGSPIFISGTTAVGKSTFIKKSNRNQIKINQYYAFSNLNLSPSEAMTYFAGNLDLFSQSEYTIHDRSTFDNFVFYILPILNNMPELVEGPINPYFNIDGLVNSFNLTAVFERINNLKMYGIIMIDSNITESYKRYTQRAENENSISQMIMSSHERYLKYQNVIYTYMSNKLNIPIIDLEFIRIVCKGLGFEYAKVMYEFKELFHASTAKPENFTGIPKSLKSFSFKKKMDLQKLVNQLYLSKK